MAAQLALLLFVGGVTIRPYVPPKLEPEPELTPSSVAAVEIVPPGDAWDANVLARPAFSAPLAGHVARGARIAVRGEVQLPGGAYGCPSRLYYALAPFGFICANETRPATQPLSSESVLQLVPGTPLPYRYVMVIVEEGSLVPMWGSLNELHEHAEPERQLGRGDTIAIKPEIEQFEGASYFVSVDDKVIPVKGTLRVEHYSQWQGVELNENSHFPFGWVTGTKAVVYSAPDGPKVDEVLQRERLDILEERTIGKKRWLRIGDDRWLKERSVNEVRKLERPTGTGSQPQWFDVDLGEQVVVAYRDDKPVYATLTSSGHEPNHTPRGNYPIWGKVTSITMKSQDYDDVSYYVNRVPWVLFFQAHNALHGAYWHDRFGNTKSHGCVNLAPKDAQYLFDWLEPSLPAGWTSVRYWDLTSAPVAHVHDTHAVKDIFQERNVGPPDKNDEAERVEKAVARREAKERDAAEAAAAASTVAGAPSPAGGVSGLQPTAAAAVTAVQPVPIAPLPAASAH
jgi:L,D-transpeptidase catalytic domain